MIALAAALLGSADPQSLRALYGASQQPGQEPVQEPGQEQGPGEDAAAAVDRAPQAAPQAQAAPQSPSLRSLSDQEVVSALWSQDFAVRGFDRDFNAFNEQVLCCAVTPLPKEATSAMAGHRIGLAIVDSPAVMARFGTSRLSELRRELACWVAVMVSGSAAQCRRLEALATASLLRRSDIQCAYRLPPLAVQAARPVVMVQLKILEAVGRERFLRALWASQTSRTDAGSALDSDLDEAGLFDSLSDRLRQHFSRMHGLG